MSALSAAAFYTGISLLLLFLLPVRVVAGRMRTRVSPGSGSDPDPELRIRAQGNAAGYIPASMPGLVVLALLTPPVWAIHVPGGSPPWAGCCTRLAFRRAFSGRASSECWSPGWACPASVPSPSAARLSDAGLLHGAAVRSI